MPESIRYGIIGTGMMGCEHILNLTLMDDVTVSAIADSNETSRGWRRSVAGDAVEVYDDYRQAFEPDQQLVVCRRDGSAPVRETFDLDGAVRAAGAHRGATFFEHRGFIDTIRCGGKPAVGIEDGALAVGVGAPAERSIREKRPVELVELGF
jgi:predicted dehydrogenase